MTHAVRFAMRCALRGFDCYVAANPRKTMAGTAADVGRLQWLWADVDVGRVAHARAADHTDESALAAVNELTGFGIFPTVLLHSGGGLHVFYLLAEAIDLESWSDLMTRVAALLGGDRNVIHVEGVLRIAGTVNCKTGFPRTVRLLSATNSIVAPEALFALLPAVTPPTSARPASSKPIMAASGATAGTLSTSTPIASAQSARGRGHLTGRPFDVANDCPVDEVLRALGYDVHREGRYSYALCPRCRGSNNRKLVVGGRSNGACCFSDCGRKVYSAVDLVIAARGCTPREAVDWLAQVFGFAGFGGGRQ